VITNCPAIPSAYSVRKPVFRTFSSTTSHRQGISIWPAVLSNRSTAALLARAVLYYFNECLWQQWIG